MKQDRDREKMAKAYERRVQLANMPKRYNVPEAELAAEAIARIEVILHHAFNERADCH